MSGAAITRNTHPLRLPRAPGTGRDAQALNGALDLLERADTSNAKLGQQPMFAGIVLMAPSGEGFLLTVDNAGALVTASLPPTRPY